jgi:membrane-associated phospholipid phosphatase
MRLKPLLTCHLLIVLLLGSFFFPLTRTLWDALDVACFKLLNGTLEGHPNWQLFWALANHKLTDWIEDIVFITFFVLAVRAAPKNFRLQKAAQFIFLILFAATIIFFVNRVLFRQNLDIPRDSPTLVVSPCVRLSDEIPWLRIKDDASSSFPGDHATTLLLFAAGYTFFAGRRLGTYAWAYAVFRALPRLIAGAHWFTDIAVGSAAITLFFLSWAFYTPLASFAVGWIEAFFRLFQRREKSIVEKYGD